jgi:RHS repeat-associated protein
MPQGKNPAESAESQSVMSAPSISLKGGGAIRGIGEKFTANPVTGTGSVTVPIATSPGRSGFGPQLSLSYDSGAGTGPFGLGWSLSLPSISRKTDKGLPRYRDAEESDEFILSGAEDLVPVVVESGEDPLRTVDLKSYRIQRYRPRIEGLFARIERWTNELNPVDSFWRSISRDNITTWYGKTVESRIADPADQTRIFSWLICESYDDKGNVISYGYKTEDSLNVDRERAHEANRTDESRSANRYLKWIRYGNHQPYFPELVASEPWPLAPGDDLWLFEVVLDYGEHDQEDPAPGDTGAWARRHDPFSSYRAAFEIRTYRLCQRVLMFHHFPDEDGVGANCLVRSTDFTYRYEQLSDQQDPADPHNRSPIHSVLTSVTQCGYRRQTGSGYFRKPLPPLEFAYSEAMIDESIHELDPESLENLPYGLDGGHYQWVDLDGEGLSGVLTEQADGWFYKANLSPIPVRDDAGKEKVVARFAPLDLVAERPSLAAFANGRRQLLDLAGDGQADLVELEQPTPGFYERTHDERWESFVPFASLPVLDWNDPNVRFVDLTGDGHADILVTEDEAFYWYPSLAEAGFGPPEHVGKTLDEEKGPRLVFADGTQSVYVADLSGDGLTDLVRIRNGDVCYWPNLGYGRFGAKITMDNAPWFDSPDLFDQRRIRLFDIDGSGVTDLLYLGHDAVQIYFNQSGNSWSDARRVTHFPRADKVSAITAVDLLGNGTACLVWSSPLESDAHRPMRYMDLMGGRKPHLLISVKNNLGAETQVQYAPSTKFYLADKAAGTPWITRLPFPVHVVERVDTFDCISRNRAITRYVPHHGYFDGPEREFRGFGLVEQWDSEEFAVLSQSETFPTGDNIDEASHVPPVLTRTWFHTGVFLGRNHISNYFAGLLDEKDTGEYYREPGLGEQANKLLLDDTILPEGLTTDEQREACRALKGSMLRQEVYALDGTGTDEYPYGHPYTVTEQNFTIRVLQPRNNNRHAVFFTHARETIYYHYERKPADPRTSHALTLEVDRFGNVLKEIAIGYGRRQPDMELSPEDRAKQTGTLITYTEHHVTNAIDNVEDDPDDYRTPLPFEIRTYELAGFKPAGGADRFRFDEWTDDGFELLASAEELLYEAEADNISPQKRLIEHVRTRYRGNDLAPLPFGVLASLALPLESYKLAFTPGLLASVFQRMSENQTPENLLPDPTVLSGTAGDQGGYVDLDTPGHFWVPSGLVFFHPDDSASQSQELGEAREHFFLARRFRDPFQQDTTVSYDDYDLLLLQTEDALGNMATAGLRDEQDNATNGNDYRVLQPTLLTDPNRAISEVRFDTLGLVVGTAIYKAGDGDSFENFETDLAETQRDDFFADPEGQAAARLGTATTRIIYDVDRYHRTGDPNQPPYAASLARETHVSEGLLVDGLKVQVSFTYSDGFGREIQKKIQAEPGPGVSPRWVGSGWTIFNNKGKPVRQYEPFFSQLSAQRHQFEFGVQVGVTPILFYDPVERVVATLHPNHTYGKVVFDPWRQITFDVNDTVLDDPRTDANILGYTTGYFASLPPSPPAPPWQTWYAERQGGGMGVHEQAAAAKAAAHAGTPTTVYLDTLGRPFLTVADNGSSGQYDTRVELDIEGNQRSVTDAKHRVVMRYSYDMLGNRIRQESVDAGKRWMLNNVAGEPIRAWDSRGHEFQTVYDALQRPTHRFVKHVANAAVLAERTVYGDSQGTGLTVAETQVTNLRGKPYLQYDGAGVVTTEQYDFKGNLLSGVRRLAKDYKQRVDWSPLTDLTNIEDIENAAALLLESDTFATTTRYDALNRVISLTTPDNSETRPTYNEANVLERMDVRLRGATTWTPFVVDIDYNAKGQRELIDYRITDSNGDPKVVRSTYNYDQLTFRLSNLNTTRTTDNMLLQDLHYTYDPVGNITTIHDQAQKTIFHANTEVRPEADYAYDALYRLAAAKGREHIGQNASPQPDHTDIAWIESLNPNDPQAMRNYTELYEYDEIGNILRMIHQANGGSWTRQYEYSADSNRLLSTSLPGDDPIPPYSATYEYDEHGSMIAMPHLLEIRPDFDDRMQQADLGGGGTVHFVYDAAGRRVRKVHEHNGATVEERIHLGNYEIYRKRIGSGLTVERETLHVMDGTRRIALVETKTQDEGITVLSPTPVIRFQLGNHLHSASLELDESGAVISYEEYHPYGTTSYRAGRNLAETSLKRYRYTGMERDEETSLYYHGARYYAPWLARWVAADPVGLMDGPGLYNYCRGNPITFHDPTGTQRRHQPAILVPDQPLYKSGEDVSLTPPENQIRETSREEHSESLAPRRHEAEQSERESILVGAGSNIVNFATAATDVIDVEVQTIDAITNATVVKNQLGISAKISAGSGIGLGVGLVVGVYDIALGYRQYETATTTEGKVGGAVQLTLGGASIVTGGITVVGQYLGLTAVATVGTVGSVAVAGLGFVWWGAKDVYKPHDERSHPYRGRVEEVPLRAGKGNLPEMTYAGEREYIDKLINKGPEYDPLPIMPREHPQYGLDWIYRRYPEVAPDKPVRESR